MALFVEAPRELDIGGFTFHPFSIEDRALFEEFYFSVDYGCLVWDNCFPFLYAYAQSLSSGRGNTLVWKVVKGFLCVFIHGKTGKISLYTNPVSKNNQGDLRGCMDAIMRMMFKINGTDKFTAAETVSSFITDQVFDFEAIKKNGGSISNGYTDFVFRCDDLIRLEGKKYKSRRHLVNQFKKEYPNHLVRYMNDEDMPAVLKLREDWVQARYGGDKSKVWDYKIVPHTIENYKATGARITVVEVDDVIQGFLIMAKLGRDCSSVINENTNLTFKGMTEFLWYESLRMNRDMGEFENDANGGYAKDSLYAYKMNHRPVAMIDRHIIVFNQKGQAVKKNIFRKG